MEKDRTIFESQYGTLVSSLASDLKLQPAFMRSLIAHESRFEEQAKNIHGSKGFMQLTSAPINDLLARPHVFAPAMKKITIPSGSPAPLIDLKKAFDSDPVNKKEISRAVPLLQ